MPQDQVLITLPTNDWVEITNSNATRMSVQAVRSGEGRGWYLRLGATKPTSAVGLYFTVNDSLINQLLSDLTPGTTHSRAWAKSAGADPITLLVSHN